MVAKNVRGIVIFGVLVVSAAFSFSFFMNDASGDFLEILQIGEAGILLSGLAFIPLGLYLVWKAY